jgi:hypothetical protein
MLSVVEAITISVKVAIPLVYAAHAGQFDLTCAESRGT